MKKFPIKSKIFKIYFPKMVLSYYFTEFNDGSYYGELWKGYNVKLKYNKNGTLNSEIAKYEKFEGISEKDIDTKINYWVINSLGSNYKVELFEEKNF